MKKFFVMAAIAATAMLTACEDEKDGEWDPIKTDRNLMVIGQAGGQDTIRLRNYSGWWLSEVDVRVNDTTIHHYGRMIESGGSDALSSMQGEWFRVYVPKENQRLLIVDCKENARCDYRELNIGVTVGDSFGNIRVQQRMQ